MAVTFSKGSGQNEGVYKAIEGVITAHINDVDTGVNNDDEVLKGIFVVSKKNSGFGARQATMGEFGNFVGVDEGNVAVLDKIQEGYGKLIEHEPFLKGFSITREMLDDSKDYIDAIKMTSANFVNSYKRSRLCFATEYLAAAGTTFTYEGKTYDRTTGDGKALFATDHLGKKQGVANQSNVFTNELWDYTGTPDALMLQRLANIGRNFKNESGRALGYTFDTIVIPGNCWQMEEGLNRIIGSAGVVGSANNDINTQKGKWRLIVNPRWIATTGTYPYLLLSSEANKELNALPFYDRSPLDVRNEIDNNTRNMNWTGYTRFSCGCFNWRAIMMGGAASGTTLA